MKKRESLLTHSAQQKSFRLQDSEFPSPFRTRISKSLAPAVGIVLTLF
jgi:hypothetical protein